jgi:hypothetical protein
MTTPALPTSLRIPPDLRDTVTSLAREQRRSISQQILWLVERGLAASAEQRAEEEDSP